MAHAVKNRHAPIKSNHEGLVAMKKKEQNKGNTIIERDGAKPGGGYGWEAGDKTKGEVGQPQAIRLGQGRGGTTWQVVTGLRESRGNDRFKGTKERRHHPVLPQVKFQSSTPAKSHQTHSTQTFTCNCSRLKWLRSFK